MLGHLFLVCIFPVPLASYLTLLRIDRTIGKPAFVSLSAIVLLFEFLSSLELFASTTVFAAFALLLACAVFGREAFRAIGRVVVEIALSYFLVTLLVVPYLYYVLAYGVPAPINPVSRFSNDLLAFALPTPVIYGGGVFKPIIDEFTAGPIEYVETAAYLGPGVWIILVLYTRAFGSTGRGKFLILSLLIIGVMSLGPTLHIRETPVSLAPWWPFSKLPLLNQAIPGRFGMYLYLTAAVIISLYLSGGPIRPSSRAVLAFVCLLFLAPNLSLFRSFAVEQVNVPSIFRSDNYKRFLAKGDNVLILPYMGLENGLLWQVETGFYFRLAAARLTLTPAAFLSWPVVSALDSGAEIMDLSEQLKAFLGAHGVKAIIVDETSPHPWEDLLSDAGMNPIEVGGVLLYKVPATVLTSFATATAHQMAEREAAISFAALITTAHRYLARGFPLAKLDPWYAQRLRLLDLPRGYTGGPSGDPRWWHNLWLGEWANSIGVGIYGDYQDLEFLVEKYGPHAVSIFFPYPARLSDGSRKGAGTLFLVFTPQGLQAAAEEAGGEQDRR